MCELDIFTVQTYKNVSAHNPTIFWQPNVWIRYLHSRDSEEWVWTQSNNLQPFKICKLDISTALTQSNVSGHNPTIASQPKCVNWVFSQFQLRGLCLGTQLLANQNVWIGYLQWSDSEYCVWTQFHYRQPVKMCESAIYPVQSQRNVSRHKPTISNQTKSVNVVFMYTVLTRGNVSIQNPKISSHPKCVNPVFTHFWLGEMCLDTISEYLAMQNVWIRYFHGSNLGACVWTHFLDL